MNALIQSMAASVLNGQIGQQVTPADQNFRLQQLGGMMQTGNVNQVQQWSNPQTGNTIQVNPVGQQSVDPNTQQNCRNLEETFTSSSGQTIRESRRACQDPNGRWVLVQ
jgi:surface antigen